MPISPAEALEKNQGKIHLQLDRAIQDLLAEVEQAIEYYTGAPIYVGLPSYLQYKLQAEDASKSDQGTLDALDRGLYERFGPAGWAVGLVTNETQSYYWAKLKDARED